MRLREYIRRGKNKTMKIEKQINPEEWYDRDRMEDFREQEERIEESAQWELKTGWEQMEQKNNPESRSRKNRSWKREIIGLLVRAAFVTLIGWLLLTQVFLLTQAGGNEMYPAVKAGDLLFGYRLQQEYAKNDIVAYRENGVMQIGRIIGKENDVVDRNEAGYLVVNGTVQNRKLLESEADNQAVLYPYTVPQGCVYILPDSNSSGDSMKSGEIPEMDIIAKIITLLRRRSL